jgi:hypothetical protein
LALDSLGLQEPEIPGAGDESHAKQQKRSFKERETGEK